MLPGTVRIMHANVTLKLDEQLLKQARKAAIDEDRSLSSWVAVLVAEALRKRVHYGAAKRRALARLEAGYDLRPGRFSREELHER